MSPHTTLALGRYKKEQLIERYQDLERRWDTVWNEKKDAEAEVERLTWMLNEAVSSFASEYETSRTSAQEIATDYLADLAARYEESK